MYFFYYESKSKIIKKWVGGLGAGVSDFFYYESEFKINKKCYSM